MMLRIPPCFVLVFWLFGTGACSDREASPDRGAPALSDTPEQAGGTLPGQAQHASADPHEAEGGQSLPLLPIMLQMAAEMSGLTQALWLEDYEQMSEYAMGLAGHAGISAEELARIEAELGPEMAAFIAADEAVHQASIRLHEAAEARKMGVVLEELSEVQQGCVGCHSRFRERLTTRKAGAR